MRIAEPGEYAILGLLVEQPRHGYALSRQFAPGTDLRQVVRLEMSQLYAILKKLEALGLITAQDGAPSAEDGAPAPTTQSTQAEHGVASGAGARTRRIYHPTSAGRAAFEAWLAEPVDRPRDLRLMFLLKLFFALHRTPEDVAALLERQERSFAAFHDTLTRQLADPARASTNGGGRSGLFGTLVLRSRLRQTEAAQTWLGDMRAALAALNGPHPNVAERDEANLSGESG